MMNGGIRLGRVAGIAVTMNWSVAFVGALLTWSLAAGLLPAAAPTAAVLTLWMVASIGAGLFFASLLAHELGHALAARRDGVHTEEITLWLFGGIAKLREEASTPGAEFRIAAAGPAVSFAAAALFALATLGATAVDAPAVWIALLGWLGLINVVLAVFNLLPGLPLDGGHILRSAIWKRTGSRLRATVAAARAGRVVGAGLMTLGAIQLFTVGGGLWIALVGLFLFTSATAERVSALARHSLAEVSVGSVMRAQPVSVRSDVDLQSFANLWVLRSDQQAFPTVGPGGHIDGLITIEQLASVPSNHRSETRVADIASPAHGRGAPAMARPETPLIDALAGVAPQAAGWILVFDERGLIGLVGPDDIARAAQRQMAVDLREAESTRC